MLKLTKYGIGAVVFGFAIDALSTALAYPMAYPTGQNGRPLPLGTGMSGSEWWSSPNPSWLAAITAESRAHALSHLGFALMLFGFALILLAVLNDLQKRSNPQN